ncbi:hypothetical protein K474DRAFT_1770348 [Panus rudis PR-1116 ss-1]|nr:hypothetical protein K474DRAFT_1770348 [Panus rudis PR-1116 ss-1]
MSTLPMGSRRHKTRQATTVCLSDNEGKRDDAKRKAILEVVQVWLDRLQLISVITTFFVGIDTSLLSFARAVVPLGETKTGWTNLEQLMTASLAAALIFHICASITSFTGSFVLIRYKLLDADRHEHGICEPPASPTTSTIPNIPTVTTTSFTDLPEREKRTPQSRREHLSVEDPTPSTLHNTSPRPHMHYSHTASSSLHHLAEETMNFFPDWSNIMSSFQGRVSINRIHPFGFLSLKRTRGREKGIDIGDDMPKDVGAELEPPVKLLSRCHTLSVIQAVCGFILAVLGILVYLWTTVARSVSIVASAVLGVCLLAATIVFNAP